MKKKKEIKSIFERFISVVLGVVGIALWYGLSMPSVILQNNSGTIEMFAPIPIYGLVGIYFMLHAGAIVGALSIYNGVK